MAKNHYKHEIHYCRHFVGASFCTLMQNAKDVVFWHFFVFFIFFNIFLTLGPPKWQKMTMDIKYFILGILMAHLFVLLCQTPLAPFFGVFHDF